MLAPASVDLKDVLGIFRNKETGVYFEYRETSDPWAISSGFKHEIFVLDGVRFANVKKTVVYVCVDEDENGNPVVEKWLGLTGLYTGGN